MVGVLFLVSCLLAPVTGIVPSAATAPALIIVGVLMLKGAASIDWNDLECAIPAFLTISMMPFAYSISDGIGFGFISYSIIKVARGKAKEVPVLVYITIMMVYHRGAVRPEVYPDQYVSSAEDGAAGRKAP